MPEAASTAEPCLYYAFPCVHTPLESLIDDSGDPTGRRFVLALDLSNLGIRLSPFPDEARTFTFSPKKPFPLLPAEPDGQRALGLWGHDSVSEGQ